MPDDKKPPTPFEVWAERHAELFGLTDAELGTVLSWERPFLMDRFTPEELNEATDYLFRNPRDRLGDPFQGKMVMHMSALSSRVRSRRAEPPPDGPDDGENRGTCTLCGGSGFASVPNLRGVKGGEWVGLPGRNAPIFYTCAVSCSCALGRWKAQRATTTDGKSILSLDEYDRLNPRWREHLARRERVAAETRKVVNEMAYAEANQVRQRLAARFTAHLGDVG